MRCFEIMNLILTKIFEIDSSFLEFFISKFLKFLKISNVTDQRFVAKSGAALHATSSFHVALKPAA
jgi:hypothetical protein